MMQYKTITIIASLLFLICSPHHLPAREPETNLLQFDPPSITFTHLTVQEGLSGNNVTAIMQDTQGFLWFGTISSGLNKYDGVEFTNYVNRQGDPNSIANNYTWRLYQDEKGTMWIVTWGGGLSRFDPVLETFINYRHDENDPNSLVSDLVWSVLVDSNGMLWVGTDMGLDKYDPDKNEFIHYRHDPNDPTSLSHNKASMILEGVDGVLWVSTYGGGLNKFDPKENTFTHYRHNEKGPHSLSNDFIWSLHRDKDDTLWLGHEGGLDKFDPETEVFTHYRHSENDPQSISGAPVTAIFRDSKERLWLGTSGHGLNLFDSESEIFLRFQNDPNNSHSLADNTVWGINEDVTGTLWFATFNGVDRYDSSYSRFIHYQHNIGSQNILSSDQVQAIYNDQKGVLWMGTRSGGLCRYDSNRQTFTKFLHDPNNPASLSNNTVLDIAQAPDGAFWVGTVAGVDKFDPQKESFVRYQHNPDDPTTLSHGAAWDMDFSPDGSLWIGTYGGGLDRFDPDSRTFTHFMPVPDNPNSIVSEWVTAVFFDSSGMLWVGTEAGLSRFDPEAETFTNYFPDQNDPHSIRDSTIHTIYQDDQGTIWIGTNQGLSKFNPEKAKFRNYDARDGLQGNQFRRKAVSRSDDGQLFFGGTNGMNSFYPEKIIDNQYIPPIKLTEFHLFNKPVAIGADSPLTQHINVAEQITLSHDQSVFSFKFAALNFRFSQKNQYAYKMQGFDKDWTYVADNQRFATYTNLDPGEYTFKVKGSNNDGIWNEQGVSIKVVILPPWWKTAWFKTLIAVMLAGLIYATFQWRLRTVNAHRRQLENEIRERKKSEERVRTIVDQAGDTLALIDINGSLLDVNQHACEVLGYTKQEFLNMSLPDIDPEFPLERFSELFKTLELNEYVTIESIHRRKDKSTFPVEIRVGKIELQGAVKITALARDITARKHMESTLEESEKRFRVIYEKAPIGIAIINSESGRFIHCNKKYCDIVGYTEEEMLARSFMDITHPDDLQAHLDNTQLLLAGKISDFSMEKRYLTKEGHIAWVTLTVVPLWKEIAKGKVHLAIVEDITARKHAEKEKNRLESQLQQALKMEAIGTLAGGIAHDFNNILSAILGYTEMAKEDLPPGSPITSDLDKVYKAGNRAKDLVNQILAFSRQSKQELKPLQIHFIVKEALKLLRSSIPKTIEIRQDIDPSSGTVLSDATQVHQITMNLCTNAYHAMRETGGVLAVTMRPVQIKEDDYKVSSFSLIPGSYIELAVNDNGVGMDKATIEKIFDPYFTTKKKGAGTGLGLSVVHGIVKSYGGHITVYSELGKGTTFRLYLPRIITDITPEETETVKIYPTGNERALIVDDEEELVTMVTRMLTSLGYHATAMTSSSEALQIFQSDPKGYDIIITDMTMPKMNGAELIQRIRGIRPDIPIILCTGFSELIDEEKALSLGIQRYLMKPVVKGDLAAAVREVLDSQKTKGTSSSVD